MCKTYTNLTLWLDPNQYGTRTVGQLLQKPSIENIKQQMELCSTKNKLSNIKTRMRAMTYSMLNINVTNVKKSWPQFVQRIMTSKQCNVRTTSYQLCKDMWQKRLKNLNSVFATF